MEKRIDAVITQSISRIGAITKFSLKDETHGRTKTNPPPTA